MASRQDTFDYLRRELLSRCGIPSGLEPHWNPSLEHQVNLCHYNWTKKYVGDTAERLLERMKGYGSTPLYSRTMPVVNSKGVGKSRCVDQLGKIGPLVISLVLRDGDEGAYPPGDPEVLRWLRETAATIQEEWEGKALCFSFVVGIISAFLDWVEANVFKEYMDSGLDFFPDESTFKKMARKWHEAMAPKEVQNLGERHHGNGNDDNPITFAQIMMKSRSPEKRKFVHNLLDWCQLIFEDTKTKYQNSRASLGDDEMDAFLVDCRAWRIERNIRPLLPLDTNDFEALRIDQQFVISFDEAQNLFDKQRSRSDSPSRRLYHWFQWTFSVLQRFPVWFIPISTDTAITESFPEELVKHPNRLEIIHYTRPLPFTEFPMNITMLQLEHFDPNQSRITLDEYSCLSHLRRIGRIDWSDISWMTPPQKVEIIVLEKLLSDSLESFETGLELSTTDSSNKWFIPPIVAILQSRLKLRILDRKLERKLVSDHLSLLRASNGTKTASEPIVASAASMWLVERDHWPFILRTFAKHLIPKGHIKAKKHMYVVLLMTMARDLYLYKNIEPLDTNSLMEVVKHHSRSDLVMPIQREEIKLRGAYPFHLKDLFSTLFQPPILSSILNANPTSTHTPYDTVGHIFKHAITNFSHWNTDPSYPRLFFKPGPERKQLLHRLLHHQSALLLPSQEEFGWAAVVPLLFQETPQWSHSYWQRLSCLLIRIGPVHLSDRAHFFLPPYMGRTERTPFLGLIFNTEYEGPPCVLQHPVEGKAYAWVLEICGSGSGVFRVVEGHERVWEEVRLAVARNAGVQVSEAIGGRERGEGVWEGFGPGGAEDEVEDGIEDESPEVQVGMDMLE